MDTSQNRHGMDFRYDCGLFFWWLINWVSGDSTSRWQNCYFKAWVNTPTTEESIDDIYSASTVHTRQSHDSFVMCAFFST